MTEEEKDVLRKIANTNKRIVEQQDRIARLTAANQPIDMAVELLCALLDKIRAQERRLEILRAAARANKNQE